MEESYLLDEDQDQKVKYSWEKDFQREILGLLLTDRVFVCQSLGLIKPIYFSDEIHSLIAKVFYQYFEKYSQIPSKVFLKQLIIDFLKERYKASEEIYNTNRLLYLAEVNNIYDYYSKYGTGMLMPGLDAPDAILDRVVTFAKIQSIKVAFHSCLEQIRRNPENDSTWVKVDEILKNARSIDKKHDLGLDYFQTIDERYDRISKQLETQEVFSVGFDSIDRNLNAGGLRRGEIGAWMAPGGVGKSLALVNACIANLFKDKKVLFITTEMDQDAVAARFDSIISNVDKRRLLENKEIVKQALMESVLDYEDKRRLVIKQFPSGTADLNSIISFYYHLKMQGFSPDLFILDYLGDLKDLPGLKTYESRFVMLRDLRGLGVTEKHCTLTAIHSRRGMSENDKEDQFLGENDMADSYNMFRVLDSLWTINQTVLERSLNIGRVRIVKHRDGNSKVDFRIAYDYTTQSLVEISPQTYAMKMSSVKKIEEKKFKEKQDILDVE